MVKKRKDGKTTTKASVKKPKLSLSRLKKNTLSSRSQYIRVTLIYCEHGFTINPGIASAGVYVFNANGLYDVNTTGVGHQPSGFDQFMALYNEYVVLGSTIKVWFSNSDANASVCAGVFLEDTSTSDLDFRKYVENGNGDWRLLDKLSSGSCNGTLKHQADITKFSTEDITSNPDYRGTSTANPVESLYYHVVVAPVDATADVGNVYGNVEIRYDVIFRDPQLAALS